MAMSIDAIAKILKIYFPYMELCDIRNELKYGNDFSEFISWYDVNLYKINWKTLKAAVR